MNPSEQLAKRFREVMLDGKWIANTNVKDQLTQTDWELALKQVGQHNSIAALTFHIGYYIEGVLQVLKGGKLEIRDKYSFDLPPIESQADWEALLDKLWSDSEEFAQCVEQLPESQLEEVFVQEKYGTYRRNIEGMVEHGYYHLGQIALLRKLIN